MAMGKPNFDATNQSPEKQMAKLRESARSGGGGGARRKDFSIVDAPITPHTEAPPPGDVEEKKGIVLELTPDVNDKDMEELLGILQTRGFDAVMKELDRINNPHLEDDFHRLLIQYKRDGHSIPGLSSDSPYAKALNFVLFEVAITVVEGKGESLQEVFNAMQQFYQSFIEFVGLPNPIFFKDWKKRKAIHRNHFVMEIAVSQGREEAVFYMAVPRSRREIFEKQVLSIYSRARVTEVKDDYNIFNQFGAVAASEAQYGRSAALPIRTGDGFATDPMNIVLAAFSRITREGEGAAVQFVVQTAGEYHTKIIRKMYDEIQKGKGPGGVYEKYAYASPDPLWRRFFPQFWKDLKKFFSSKEEKHDDKSVDSFASESINKKLKFPVVGVNVRLVASARTTDRAQAILSDLEATFGQFDDPHGNRIKFARKKGAELKAFLRKFIFRLAERGIKETRFPPWKPHQPFGKGLLRMNYAELAALFHLSISGATTSREVKLSNAKLAPAPPNLPKNGILIGRNRYSNVVTDIHFTPLDRMRHLYTIGQTGTGKTVFLKNMILQDIMNGDGVCFIDPHGPDVLEILSRIPKERYDDVIYFDPAHTDRPMGLNMLEYDPRFPEQKTFVVDEMFQIFKKLYGDVPEAFGPIFEQYFRNAAGLVVEDPETGSTLMDIARVLADEDFRHLKLSRCRNPVIAHFWEEVAENVRGEGSLANIVPYITSKFDIFIANEIMRPIVGQQRSAFDFKDILDNKKIFLVNLSKGRLGETNANLLGLILVGKIMMTALARDLSSNPPPFYLYLDEFQNITTKTIAIILAEARKFKLSMTMAHQFTTQLQQNIKEAVFGNVGSMAIFRIGPDDAPYIAKQFEPTFTAQDMLHIDNYHAYVKLLSEGKPITPFSIETIPFTPGDQVTADALKQMSYQRYGRARDTVEAEIMEKYNRMIGK